MRSGSYNLAIETSSRHGSITLGCDDELLACVTLGPQRRHNVALVPAIDRLTREHGLSPADVAQWYVSLGPGSFTGLRVALTTVKMFALVHGSAIVGVPSLDVLAQNVPSSEAPETPEVRHVAVGLNLKRGTMHSAIYRREPGGWQRISEARLRTLAELLDEAPRPVVLLGDPLPTEEARLAAKRSGALLDGVTILSAELAVPRSEAVWRLGRAAAKRGDFADPVSLVPLYIREPEAVTLWNERH